MITVYKTGRKFGLKIKAEEHELLFVFKQLTYRIRNLISSLTTQYKQGVVTQDAGMNCFYLIKYGLKDAKGLKDENGVEYKLKFEGKDKEALTDECVEELLAAEFQATLIYAANQMLDNIPDEIVHPITKEAIKGVEIVPPEDLQGALKKF